MTLERRNSFVGTPTTRTSDTMGWQMLTESFFKYVCGLYELSTEKGDKYLGSNLDLLSKQFPLNLPVDFSNPSKDLIVPLVRIVHHAPSIQTVHNILRSKGIRDPMEALQTMIIHWSLYSQLHENQAVSLRELLHDKKALFQEDMIPQLINWANSSPIEPYIIEFLKQGNIPLLQK
jgi:hypothetical protein